MAKTKSEIAAAKRRGDKNRERGFSVRVKDLEKRIPFIKFKVITKRQKFMRLGVRYIDFLEKMLLILLTKLEGKEPPKDAPKKFSDFKGIVSQVLAQDWKQDQREEEPMNREEFVKKMEKYEVQLRKIKSISAASESSSSTPPVLSPQQSIPPSPATPATNVSNQPSPLSHVGQNSIDSPKNSFDCSTNFHIKNPNQSTMPPNPSTPYQMGFYPNHHIYEQLDNFNQVSNAFNDTFNEHFPTSSHYFPSAFPDTSAFTRPQDPSAPNPLYFPQNYNQPGPSNYPNPNATYFHQNYNQPGPSSFSNPNASYFPQNYNQPGPSNFPNDHTAQILPPVNPPRPVSPLKSPMTFEEACARNMMYDYMKTPNIF